MTNTTTIYTDICWSIKLKQLYMSLVVEDVEGSMIFDKVLNKVVKGSCEAEYYGVIFALEIAHRHTYVDIRIRCDNDVVVGQLRGHYEVKENLLKLYETAKVLMESLPKAKISYVKGALNKADKHSRRLKAKKQRKVK